MSPRTWSRARRTTPTKAGWIVSGRRACISIIALGLIGKKSAGQPLQRREQRERSKALWLIQEATQTPRQYIYGGAFLGVGAPSIATIDASNRGIRSLHILGAAPLTETIVSHLAHGRESRGLFFSFTPGASPFVNLTPAASSAARMAASSGARTARHLR